MAFQCHARARTGSRRSRECTAWSCWPDGDDSQRLHFVDDSQGLPCEGSRCRTKAYLVIGDDAVSMGPSYRGLTCVWFKAKGRQDRIGAIGWLPTSSLGALPFEKAPAPRAWSGTWVRDRRLGLETQLTIAPAAAGGLKVTGDSAYAASREIVEKWGPNVGEVDDTLRPAGWRAGLLVADADGRLPSLDPKDADYDCRIGLALLGDWLVAVDNNSCGGAHVSFSGVYRRER